MERNVKTAYDEVSAGRAIISLVKFSESEFMVLSENSRFNVFGTLHDAAGALSDLGVPFAEIVAARLDLANTKNNVAEFGIYNYSFMFSRFEARYAQICGIA